MPGTNARTPLTTPQTFTPHTQRQSSSLMAHVGPVIETPALLNSRCTWPKRSFANAASSSTSEERDTSVTLPATSKPADFRRDTASSSAPASTSASTSLQPSPPNRLANASPIPLAPPVMTATLPLNSCIPSLSLSRGDPQDGERDVARPQQASRCGEPTHRKSRFQNRCTASQRFYGQGRFRWFCQHPCSPLTKFTIGEIIQIEKSGL